MEVIYTGLRQSPEAIAEAAAQEDVDVVGLSVLSGAHLSLTQGDRGARQARRRSRPLVIVGGNIPPGITPPCRSWAWPGSSRRARPRGDRRVRSAERAPVSSAPKEPRPVVWESGLEIQAGLWPRGRRRSGGDEGIGARRVSVHARHPPAHVPRAPLDDAPVLRLRHRRRDPRALPVPDRERPDRAQRRLRPADAVRPRLRRPDGRGRGRPRRHGGRHPGRHGGGLRRTSRSTRSRCR